MVETMALIEDTVGVAPIERSEFLVCGGGVNPIVDGVRVLVVLGIGFLVLKDIMESMVDEVSMSIIKAL